MNALKHRLCTAPMMDWSDRHCRYFFRQLAPHAVVYTEMVTTGALTHGNVERHLAFDAAEHPVALQLGGSERSDLAHCARLAEQYGFDEINLNCGCPSERVQRGAFGACLMAEPELVADCVKAMRDATSLPVTVKHRLGIDAIEHYDFVRRFVETVATAGCKIFIVHARNAVLKGLSPKDNRQVPALKYPYVYRLKTEFPQLEFVINGGLVDVYGCLAQLAHVDGVMLGRAAYHDPCILSEVEERVHGGRIPARREIAQAMYVYAGYEVARGTALRAITRHMLGLYHGRPGARIWRRMLSDAGQLAANQPDLILAAAEATEAAERNRERLPALSSAA
jgi:tRNA-dihydrouridine synthase A